MTSPTLIAAYEPVRAELRPPECRGDGSGPCWVTAPYEALESNLTVRCKGCGGRPKFRIDNSVQLGRGRKYAR